MEDFKYNYFTVYLTEYTLDFKRYRFYKNGFEGFTESSSIVCKTDTLMTLKEFEETIIKGTKYSSISSKISISDLKERLETLLEEVSVLNKQAKNQKVIIDWDKFPTINTAPELNERILNNLNEHVNLKNRPMKEVEASLFQAFWWLNLNDE